MLFICISLKFTVYTLNFKHISPMQKIENLFDFMTEEIDIFLGYEFYMAVLLFLGKQEERGIAAGVQRAGQPVPADLRRCAGGAGRQAADHPPAGPL